MKCECQNQRGLSFTFHRQTSLRGSLPSSKLALAFFCPTFDVKIIPLSYTLREYIWKLRSCVPRSVYERLCVLKNNLRIRHECCQIPAFGNAMLRTFSNSILRIVRSEQIYGYGMSALYFFTSSMFSFRSWGFFICDQIIFLRGEV